jgi:hypothetical protein
MTQRIVDILVEFGNFVQQNKSCFSGKNSITDNVDKYRTITQNQTYTREMLRKLRDDALLEMYRNCGALAEKYNLRSRRTIVGYNTAILIRDGTGETAEKLMYQVRKFGDRLITERLADVEIGENEIAFEEMEEGVEGYTKIENDKTLYCLNKKYERVTAQEELWKAVIILSHELQRNPINGDLRGETAEIVLRDIEFVERLASEYGEGVYDNNPEFAILHKVKELCGEEDLKEFIDMKFNHKGSYFDLEEQYWEDYENLDYWTGADVFNAMYAQASRELNTVIQNFPSNMAKMAGQRLIKSAEFMHKNGGTIALACYATGRVELGLVVDGITFICDITVYYRRYRETGNARKFRWDLFQMLLYLAMPEWMGRIMGREITLANREFAEKFIPFVTNFTGFSTAKMQDLLNELERTDNSE